jgi:predicted small lipoprotein YifL
LQLLLKTHFMQHPAAAFSRRQPVGRLRLLTGLGSLLALSACGFKGPLVLPPGPPPVPLFGTAAPKPAPAPVTPVASGTKNPATRPQNTNNDTSTDKDSARP